MSRLHQIQLQFDAHEDRAILCILTDDNAEYRFWLSRRFLRLLWPLLVRIVYADEQVQLQANPSARQAVLAFRHEHALQQADFASRYDAGQVIRPLGDKPILLAKAQLRGVGLGQHQLLLSPLKGRGVELRLDQRMVHSVCKLLQDINAKAGWDLDLTLPSSHSERVADDAAKRPN